MSKLLIAIKSCQRDMRESAHRSVRKTWGRDFVAAGIDLKFFVGGDTPPEGLQPDEVWVNCPDSYVALPYKTIEILRYSLANGYDYTHLLDNDTYTIVERLLACGFEGHDYVGLRQVCGWNTVTYNPFCHGGYGYFVSRKFAELIVAADPGIQTAEDGFCGDVAAANGIALHHPGNYAHHTCWHFPKSAYSEGYSSDLQWLEQMHEKYRRGDEKILVHCGRKNHAYHHCWKSCCTVWTTRTEARLKGIQRGRGMLAEQDFYLPK
jgi:hypothetical protein